MTYRVLRLLEYRYDDADRMLADQAAWSVQGTERFGSMTVRSTVLPGAELIEDEPPTLHSRVCCTVHLTELLGMARGQVEIQVMIQPAFGGVLCPFCAEKFVDNQVTRVVRAESFVKGEGS